MVLLDGEWLISSEARLPFNNRGTYYGDALFETIRCFDGKPLLFEAHYFRLMASMRIMRMSIPDTFTPEFFEENIEKILYKNGLQQHARIRITVWRQSGGLYTPTNQEVNYSIESQELQGQYKIIPSREVELFKDHYTNTGLLANLKIANKQVNVLAGIFAVENGFDDMFLVNHNKMIVETIAGNIFLRKGKLIKTPRLQDGCLNGIMREQVLQQFKKMLDYTVVEDTITPFELQRADEIFTSNVIKGIQPITQYRKKTYSQETAAELITIFNDLFFRSS
ncbi:MAG: aminotransferase class IV [Nonlabens sp.]